ncbi:Pre-rRNA-processing protein las1 [Lasiodiplodia hormozganensis]|uniref:Pre-rRNA-processing protein las1 n=1 Tax=Lasiodiplodia hormozganensis TaxID=869390 RepID=A0AA39Z5Q1_9PEZI|nr:Pre-rRNA-processing protein las1 [Lasiodiplodia hormozganensis]
MPRFQITPWRHHAELLALRARLYHAGPEERQNAVFLISAWKRRAPLPHALDSTAQLVDATLHDDPQRASVLAIRNAYCAAFNRFVTGFCDTVQNSFKKMSMYDMAAELDMPSSFVELRHEATHEDLPSLRRLQMATEQALQWLWHHYWAKLDASLPAPPPENRDQVAGPETRASLHRILRSFVSGRREEIKRDGPKSGVEARSSGRAIEQIVALGAAKRPGLLRDEVISLLLAGRMIVPSDARVGDSLDGAHLIWDSLLCRLNSDLQYVETLVEHMFRYMLQPSKADVKSDAFKAAMYNWILHVLTSEAWSSSCSYDVRQRLWATTMTACMTQPSYWSKKLAKELLLEGDDDFQDEWLPILEASLPEAQSESEGMSSEPPGKNEAVPESQSDEEMRDAIADSPGHPFADAKVQPRPGGWRKWEGEWRSTPIGLVPT